jgi:hypothetical protein
MVLQQCYETPRFDTLCGDVCSGNGCFEIQFDLMLQGCYKGVTRVSQVLQNIHFDLSRASQSMLEALAWLQLQNVPILRSPRHHSNTSNYHNSNIATQQQHHSGTTKTGIRTENKHKTTITRIVRFIQLKEKTQKNEKNNLRCGRKCRKR